MLTKYTKVRVGFLNTIGEYGYKDADSIIGYDLRREKYAVVPFDWMDILLRGGCPSLKYQYKRGELALYSELEDTPNAIGYWQAQRLSGKDK